MPMTGSAMTRAYILKQKLKRTKGRFDNMKVYLVPTKQGYIQRKGIFKPNEIVPFLQSVIKRQAVILANIKKAGCH